jgi:hypothetical protein
VCHLMEQGMAEHGIAIPKELAAAL